MFLFEKLDVYKEAGNYKDMPAYIVENLNSGFEIRPYQAAAFSNFITYYENENLRKNPTQVLFHMATGSGKTLIMAGLIIYLYKQGYRNFLFFVNLENIIKKTKDNFLNSKSKKFLFSDEIDIDGEKIQIKEVDNFQYTDTNSINICFITTQKLHYDMWQVKENSISFDDFVDQKIVFISDEAHHLNVDTRQGRNSTNDAIRSWEYTVDRIFNSNNKNILLEFTATCDLENPYILSVYEDKIVFEYALKKFREEKYSKEVKTFSTDIPLIERALQAVMLSQYRLKIFQDYRLDIKPVVLFKAARIIDSNEFMKLFLNTITSLTSEMLERISHQSNHSTLQSMYKYFLDNGINFERLVQEIKEEFCVDRCISYNSKEESIEKQIAVNTLEDQQNPYRAIFAVDKLNEGWDVLNLFDIVRLYETRDARNGKPGKTTIAEAQLIGRGARYCPFVVEENQNKYQRKYDNDIENPLRICEELYYHCQYDSRYVAELNVALIETGLFPQKTVEVNYDLKEEFKENDFYKNGLVFFNQRKLENRQEIFALLPSIREKEYYITIHSGKTAVDVMMDIEHSSFDVKTYIHRLTIGEISEINYSIIYKALRQIDIYKFNILKSYFPNLKSMREFITHDNYLGNIKLIIESREEFLSPNVYYKACLSVFIKIGHLISNIEDTYVGTKEFKAKRISEVFKNKKLNITDPHGEGIGVSQNDSAIRPAWRIDLNKEDWFVFNDNYGTSEEKAFVSYFRTYIEKLKNSYDIVYLLRNERQLALYSFSDGERFEPDYLLFLQRKNSDGFEQYQIFIEPKGTQLLANDKWKEDFLLEIKDNGIPIKKFVDDNRYRIWGFPFFNQEKRMKEFSEEISRL